MWNSNCVATLLLQCYYLSTISKNLPFPVETSIKKDGIVSILEFYLQVFCSLGLHTSNKNAFHKGPSSISVLTCFFFANSLRCPNSSCMFILSKVIFFAGKSQRTPWRTPSRSSWSTLSRPKRGTSWRLWTSRSASRTTIPKRTSVSLAPSSKLQPMQKVKFLAFGSREPSWFLADLYPGS